ncbi:MAG: DUF2203 family protein [Aliifodinibius sp.]|nr:DUF2203 family protein [Fodinibius sp.]
MLFKEHFTVQEAVKTLPLVKRIVKDILDTSHQIRSMGMVLQDKTEDHPQIEELVEQLKSYIAELEEMGCFYKDWNFSIGLVDFPAIIDGEEVFLCWRSDEAEIKYYHEIEAGYAGRKLITE